VAAITPVAGPKAFYILRNASAQANTGQTDWVSVPAWASVAIIYLNWTAKAGTSPLMDFSIDEADPVALDDTYVTPLEGWDGITQLAAEDLITVRVGPHRSANDDTGVDYHVATLLPAIMGFKLTMDRTSANETYTYTLSVVFK